ncbi:AraC family transcriptional regulator [Paenibacillus sp. JZ16]|uniref:AraC family transcriptional regulator n=1 Tax=unclassified Paenibacillus TaxID=185978 RepID=UPI00188A284F|nr:AraC family transcriptional regulator [Paenibacillus sp. JZ16]
MYHWSQSEERLNRYAGRLEGESLSFLVHYWGTVRHLTANSIHRHSFYEICYVDGGTGVYTDENQTYPLYEGVAFCTRPGRLHQIKDVHDLNLLFVAFEAIEKPSAPDVSVKYMEALDRCAVWTEHAGESPATQIWKSMLIRSESDDSLPASLLPKLAHVLLQSFPGLLGASGSFESAPLLSSALQLIQKAKLYIRDNLSGPVSLPEVAAYLNVSERQLSRLFAESIHESFTTMVRTERIRAAELMLQHTQDPIKVIAERTGFSSVHYFTRLFTKFKGIPPAAYRAKWALEADQQE